MATPEPGASRITLFSGEPETCLNLSRPALLVTSSKTTGAPSTNPPAVIGRCFSSSTGAKIPPVDAPPDCDCVPGCSFGMGWGFSCWPPPKSPGAIAAQRTHASKPPARPFLRRANGDGALGRDGMASRLRIARPHSRFAAPPAVQTVHFGKLLGRLSSSSHPPQAQRKLIVNFRAFARFFRCLLEEANALFDLTCFCQGAAKRHVCLKTRRVQLV